MADVQDDHAYMDTDLEVTKRQDEDDFTIVDVYIVNFLIHKDGLGKRSVNVSQIVKVERDGVI